MNSPAEPPRNGFRTVLFVLAGIAVLLALVTGGVLGLLLLRSPRAPQIVAPSPAPETPPPEAAPEAVAVAAPEEKDFSQTSTVTLRLGEESPQDGLRHLFEEPDGRTTITNLDGVLCRSMQRPGRNNGFLYFTLSPTFKAAGLTNARCEVEYFTRRFTTLRLQYDAVEFERHRPYKTAQAEDGQAVNFGDGGRFSRVMPSNGWQTATFLLRDGVFQNSQNGGADMRLEVAPPDIFVRRVTISKVSEP